MLTQENIQRIESLKRQFPEAQAATIPALWVAQRQFGWLSAETIAEVASILGLPDHHVLGVATFYTMFNKQPVGKYHIQVCTNVSCQLLGSVKISEYICNQLKIRPGETTADGRFTFSEVECLGSCGTAPVMQVNDIYYERVTQDTIDALLREMK
jgi:NADH-quinone oxidoreductase E subunit